MTTNPIPVKAALQMAGLIDSGAMRLPMVPATEEQRSAIRPALEAAGILAAAGLSGTLRVLPSAGWGRSAKT